MSFEYPLHHAPSAGMRVIDYEKELNGEQLAAVTAPPGPVLVIAGAGSGKTRTLTYRVSYLIEKGVAPENILLLTFTNKASREMLDRVGSLLPHDLTRLWGGTFHHIGNRLLRRHPEAAGLTRSFTILDRDDAAALMKTCLEDLGVSTKDKKIPKPDVILEVLSLAVNTDNTLAGLIEKQFAHLDEHLELLEKTAAVYARKKLAANAADYDDLLVLPLRLFHGDAALLARYQKQFQHILVDEYQDTNKIQARLVDLLGGTHHQIMVVGDDAQSIYSWRGAHFANIMTFPDRHPGTRIIRLETNYRSVPEILELANETISQNVHQFPKHLRAVRAPGGKPVVVALEDSRQQAHFIAQRSLELMEDGIEPGSIAVLYRSHFHSMEIQMELTRRNMPFHITSGLRFFEQAHVKDVAAFLRFLINRQDEVSFRRVAQLLPGIGDKTCARLWREIREDRPWDSLKIPEKARAAWQQWGETDRQLRAVDASKDPANLIRVVVSALYEDYLKATYANYASRLEDLGQLQNFASGYTDTGEFLAQLALLTSVDAEASASRESRGGLDQIRLSTIHQAKGLEFQAVFVVMLCEGMFPSNRSMETEGGEEEERRLFYVAVTRAQDHLYLTYPRVRMIGGQNDIFQSPSRFLSDFSRERCELWKIRAPEPAAERWADDPF